MEIYNLLATKKLNIIIFKTVMAKWLEKSGPGVMSHPIWILSKECNSDFELYESFKINDSVNIYKKSDDFFIILKDVTNLIQKL